MSKKDKEAPHRFAVLNGDDYPRFWSYATLDEAKERAQKAAFADGEERFVFQAVLAAKPNVADVKLEAVV